MPTASTGTLLAISGAAAIAKGSIDQYDGQP
jgi:hypothetical protein